MTNNAIKLRWAWWNMWYEIFMMLCEDCLDKLRKVNKDYDKYLEEQVNE